eukprot:jgi/Mesen1/4059/ME000213S03087
MGSVNEASPGGVLTKPLDVEEFRAHAHRMVDFIADYYRDIESFPVRSQVEPGYLRPLLPEEAPEEPEALSAILEAGFLGDMLSGALNVVGFSWIASPAATELETAVLDWLARLLGLPPAFTSQGCVAAMRAREEGLSYAAAVGRLVAYTSDQAHSSVQKACMIAGIENFRMVPTDASTSWALNPAALETLIAEDRAKRLVPFFLCATVGTTSSTAVDPLSPLGDIAMENDMWLHVDSAYAGPACMLPEYRHHLEGVEKADSFNMNAHKWMLTNFDCSCLLVKDCKWLVEALSISPEFLRNKMVAPRTFSLVCFRVKPPSGDPDNGKTLNATLLENINASGRLFFTHTVLSGTYTLRIAIGAVTTEMRHVEAAWAAISEEATSLLKPRS